MSFLAVVAAPLLISCVPVKVPGGKPVIDDPGERPMLPLITVVPVFVMVDAAKTPYCAAVPSN